MKVRKYCLAFIVMECERRSVFLAAPVSSSLGLILFFNLHIGTLSSDKVDEEHCEVFTLDQGKE